MLARNGTARYASGKPILVFRSKASGLAPDLFPISIPCSQCVGCRLEYARQWSIRCVLESKMHDRNCFITLTYRDLPGKSMDGVSLCDRDRVLFMKKLRKRFGCDVLFYAAGEYTKAFRPHFHILLFGVDFNDKVYFKLAPSGEKLYRSAVLEKLWPHGYSSIGNVTFESAGYVARYTMKKVSGIKENDDFRREIEDRGLVPEFVRMSRGRGIGRAWFEKYRDEVFPLDRVWMREMYMKPPKFFTDLHARDHPVEVELIKLDRKNSVDMRDQTNVRLDVRERSKLIDVQRLKKSLEVSK
nr:replication associated protein [Flumine microvirus 9]